MTPDTKQAIERLAKHVEGFPDDWQIVKDVRTALSHIAQLERDLEELVRVGNDLSEACMWRGLFADKLSALRAAIQRHKEP